MTTSEIKNQAIPKLDAESLQQMNRVLRHKLRNHSAGMKMTLTKISNFLKQEKNPLADRCYLMNEELDSLMTFSTRMDLVFSDIEEIYPQSLFDVAFKCRDYFIKTFPLCNFELNGGEDKIIFPEGNLLLILLKEALNNAGEAAGTEGHISLKWTINDEFFCFSIINNGEILPQNIPTNPPKPFFSPKSKHDGLGLAIIHRICSYLSAELSLDSMENNLTILAITLKKRSFVNE